MEIRLCLLADFIAGPIGQFSIGPDGSTSNSDCSASARRRAGAARRRARGRNAQAIVFRRPFCGKESLLPRHDFVL